MRGFWFQKKTVQLKTALREVYTYVLNGFFFQKTVYLQGFWPKSAYLKVTVMQYSVHCKMYLMSIPTVFAMQYVLSHLQNASFITAPNYRVKMGVGVV